MPKEAKEAQEVENDLKVDTDANLRAIEEASELESAQEANEPKAEENSQKGFFAKAVDKAKEATSELFSTTQKESKQTTQATPKLKSILKKGVKFTSVTAFLYKGEEEFILKIGGYPYIIQSGEVLIVPNDKTAQYLRYKEQLFSEITD